MQKNLSMKASFLFLALAATFSCNIIDPPLPMGEPREWAYGRSPGSYAGNSAEEQQPDTTFIVSAVAFPESYDWQRDSAFGAVASTIIIYRNGRKSLEFPAGPAEHVSVSPDMHHIIGGALYTEYTDSKGTLVKKDGKYLVSWAGQEKLIGLLVKDSSVHSVGLASGGRSLTYRVNGQVVLNVTGGVAFGGFSSCGYGDTGALYIDSGSVCFSYKTVNGKTESAFLVKDGEALNLMSSPGTEILDARIRNGRPLIFYNEDGRSKLSEGGVSKAFGHPGLSRWIEGRIVEYRGRAAVEGSFLDRLGNTQNALGWSGGAVSTGKNPGFVYCNGQDYFKIDMSPPAYPGYYLFHRNCACLTGDGIALVLTPKEKGGQPVMKYGSKTVKFNLYGYLSGIAVETKD